MHDSQSLWPGLSERGGNGAGDSPEARSGGRAACFQPLAARAAHFGAEKRSGEARSWEHNVQRCWRAGQTGFEGFEEDIHERGGALLVGIQLVLLELADMDPDGGPVRSAVAARGFAGAVPKEAQDAVAAQPVGWTAALG